MKKLLLVLLIMIMFLGTTAAVIRLVRVTAVNKLNHIVYVQLLPTKIDEGIPYYFEIPAKDERVFTIIPAEYVLKMYGGKDGQLWDCFGEVDDQLYDDNAPKRLLNIQHQSKIIAKTCYQPPLNWFALKLKDFEYQKKLFSYVY